MISLGKQVYIPSPRYAGNLLGPCFNTGPINGLILMYFLYFILYNYFQLSLAVLFCYRSLFVFSFRCSYHLFILHYQTILLFQLSDYRGLSPPMALFSKRFYRHLYNFTLPLELFLVRSLLLKKSKFVSFPVLNDMLKFRTYSCISASFQPHNIHCDYRILYVGHRLENLSILYMRCFSN